MYIYIYIYRLPPLPPTSQDLKPWSICFLACCSCVSLAPPLTGTPCLVRPAGQVEKQTEIWAFKVFSFWWAVIVDLNIDFAWEGSNKSCSGMFGFWQFWGSFLKLSWCLGVSSLSLRVPKMFQKVAQSDSSDTFHIIRAPVKDGSAKMLKLKRVSFETFF